jgi:hypothetical protein
LPTFVVTIRPSGCGHVNEKKFKTSKKAEEVLEQRRRAREFARLFRHDGRDTVLVEVAHTRKGVMYMGLNPTIDWADLAQVVDVWERAKGEILARLGDDEHPGAEFARMVDDVIQGMSLPPQWSERLQRAVMKMRPEIEASLVLSR